MNGVLAIYDAAVEAAVALVFAPWERLRRLAPSVRREDLEERLGAASASGRQPTIFLHAVSAGEMAAAGALVRALARRIPGAGFRVTTGNRAGLAAGEALRAREPAVESVSLLPWDRRRGLEKWLDRVEPAAVVVVETEVWPNLFLSAARRRTPVVVVHGRVLARDVARYRLARPFFRRVLAGAEILAQNEDERGRFIAIGADPSRVRIGGNLKYDAASDIAPAAARAGVRIVAGSTHAGEEARILRAFARLRSDFPGVSLLLAPRDVGRTRQIENAAARLGLPSRRASSGGTSEVVILDRIGGLVEAYAAASVAIVGGSFVRHGGHNPLEPAAAGCAVLVGPHHENFGDVVAGMRESGAVEVVAAERLEEVLRRLLRDPAARSAMGERGRAFVRSGKGAAERCADAIARAIATATVSGAGPAEACPPGSAEAFLPPGSAGRGT